MPPRIDLSGKTFGKLTVINCIGQHHGVRKKFLYRCQCECGNFIDVIDDNLKHGNTTSCGCARFDIETHVNLVGQIFNYLEVIQLIKRIRKNHYLYLCKCIICGNMKEASNHSLESGHIKSCGCINNKHNPPEYNNWLAMKQRCNNPNTQFYPIYGGRGITVCSSWEQSFKSFLNDMGPKPGPEYSIHRIDNDDNYYAENCVWATPEEQAQFRSNNKVTVEMVLEIRKLWSTTSLNQLQLADMFNVHNSLIGKIVNRKLWKNV